jgi:NADPH:quinone reductase-like Zn-dependent oxidoreductase
MKGIQIDGAGGPEVLKLRDFEDPTAGEGEVVIKVVATAVTRADSEQRQGKYPPPAGASPILGLECSGVIASLGHGVTKWKVGDEVGLAHLCTFVSLDHNCGASQRLT